MIVLKMMENRTLVITKADTIYQDENNAEILKIILPKTLNNIDLRDCDILLGFVNQSNLGNVCDLTPYLSDYSSNRYVVQVPMYQMFTYEPGVIEMWIKILHSPTEMVAKTNSVSHVVVAHRDAEGVIPEQEMSVVDRLITRVGNVEIAVDDVNDRVDDTNERVDDTNDRVDSVSNRVDNAESRLDGIDSNIEDIHNTTKDIVDSIDEANVHISEINNALNAVTGRVGVVEQRADNIDSEIVTINNQINNIENDIDDLSDRVSTNENEIGDLTDRIDNIVSGEEQITQNIVVGRIHEVTSE